MKILWGMAMMCAAVSVQIAALGQAYHLGRQSGQSLERADQLDLRLAQQAAAHAREDIERRDQTAIAAGHLAADEKIRTVYRTITREVPTYVTPETDRRFPLSFGFVRLHDAAALGVPAFTLPASGEPDDAAAAVTASEAARVIAGNYEACTRNARQLGALEDAIRRQAGYAP